MIFSNTNLSQTEPHLRTTEVVVLLPQKQSKEKQGQTQNIYKKSENFFLIAHTSLLTHIVKILPLFYIAH